jgi:hypothetical protein
MKRIGYKRTGEDGYRSFELFGDITFNGQSQVCLFAANAFRRLYFL